jgi:hypothetical protein
MAFMVTIKEIEDHMTAISTFRAVLRNYHRFIHIAGVTVYYDGHPSSTHSKDDEDTFAAAKEAILYHWKNKLSREFEHLKKMGIDASAEMPKGFCDGLEIHHDRGHLRQIQDAFPGDLS